MLLPEPVVAVLAAQVCEPFFAFSQDAIVWKLQFLVVPGPFRQYFPDILPLPDIPAAEAAGAASAKADRTPIRARILRIACSLGFPPAPLQRQPR